jgi:hypothetical protein
MSLHLLQKGVMPECSVRFTSIRPKRTICARVATLKTKHGVLDSLDLYPDELSSIEGAAVVPHTWGTPPGRLFSEGQHVCDLEALSHLGISFETGPITIGREHFKAALLSAVLHKLERRHVGVWLFEAAAKPEAAYLFETFPVLKQWLHQLAEQKCGKHRYLFVQMGDPRASEASDWLQTLSSSFCKELHNIPVAFAADTAAQADELLFNWLLGLEDSKVAPTGFGSKIWHTEDLHITCEALDSAEPVLKCQPDLSGLDRPEPDAPVLESQARLDSNISHLGEGPAAVLGTLQRVVAALPQRPVLLLKQLTPVGTARFAALVESNVPAAITLAAAAANSAAAAAAAGCVVAAGRLEGAPVVCVVDGLLGMDAVNAGMRVILAAQEGLGLTRRQCDAAVAVAAAQ